MFIGITLNPFMKQPSGIGKGRGGKSNKAQPQAPSQATSIPQAKTIAEANKLAVSLGLAKHADFDELDVSVANEMIAQIKATKDLIPDLPELEIIGDTAAVRFYLGGAYMKGDANASFLEVKGGSHNGQIGIGVNSRYYSRIDIQSGIAELKENVMKTWAPVGGDTVKAIIDHEIGHWIDHKYDLRHDSRIRKLFRTYHERQEYVYSLPNGEKVRGSQKMGSVLSRYANTNTAEFIAEAWLEYRNNPNPRPVAQEVGDIVMSYVRR